MKNVFQFQNLWLMFKRGYKLKAGRNGTSTVNLVDRHVCVHSMNSGLQHNWIATDFLLKMRVVFRWKSLKPLRLSFIKCCVKSIQIIYQIVFYQKRSWMSATINVQYLFYIPNNYFFYCQDIYTSRMIIFDTEILWCRHLSLRC